MVTIVRRPPPVLLQNAGQKILIIMGMKSYNSFLIVSFPKPEVQILDYNRVVKDLNGFSVAGLVSRLGDSFAVEKSADR